MDRWPPIPYADWRDTCTAVHLWCQIVGKYRLARTPWVNHGWHATLYVTPEGLSTGPIDDGGRTLELHFDFHDHALVASADSGQRRRFPLGPMSVAAFLGRTKDTVEHLGGRFAINGRPNEMPDPVPFAEDHAPRPYDADAVERFHRALLAVQAVMLEFRTGFLGKVSPVHLFWGSFDLAVTRFSGRPAPPHPGGIPNLPDSVTREAYSHEVSSAGFWPGGAGVDEAMFYSYAYPAPASFSAARVRPAEARWDPALGEFLLPYAVVATARDPEAVLLEFLESTYVAAADTGHWDRRALECALGAPLVPRRVGPVTAPGAAPRPR